MILNTQTVTQESLFKDLNDTGHMKILFQILVSRKYYMNFKIWLHSLYIILSSWIRFWGPAFSPSRNYVSWIKLLKNLF